MNSSGMSVFARLSMNLVYTAQVNKEPTALRDVYINTTHSVHHKVMVMPPEWSNSRLGRGVMDYLGEPYGRRCLS